MSIIGRKRKNKIVNSTLLMDIIEGYPKVASILTDEYGFFCMSCPLAFSETIGEGMEVHGLAEKEQIVLLAKLNKIIE